MQFESRRCDEGGQKLMTCQRDIIHRNLSVGPSTLGPSVGLGLFATKPIKKKNNSGILCYLFGKLVVSVESELSNSLGVVQGLRKNAIQYPTM